MHPSAEQGLHLLWGDQIADGHALQTGHAGAHPHAGRLTSLAVARRQAGVALLGGVLHGDLPGQVAIPHPAVIL
jgi:hypothetical protein